MNKSLERRIKRLEQAAGLSGCDDPRVYSYPATFAEMVVMASMSEEKLQEHLRTRRRRPSPEVCDKFDELFKEAKKRT
ncbi:MAG: hypothetical protein ACYS30_17710 [Planctomycetota bacterium]